MCANLPRAENSSFARKQTEEMREPTSTGASFPRFVRASGAREAHIKEEVSAPCASFSATAEALRVGSNTLRTHVHKFSGSARQLEGQKRM